MLTITPILMLAFFATCLLVAGWPLLRMRQLRPALLGLTGSSCVLAGAIGAGLVGSGLIGPSDFAAQVAAQEPSTPDATNADSTTAEATTADAKAPDSATSEPTPAATAANPSVPAAESTPPPDAASPSPPSPTPNPSAADPVIEMPPTTVIIPPGRPKWVEEDPQTTTSGVHTIPVSSGPYMRHSDAIRALNTEIEKASHEYIAAHVGSQLAPSFLRYDARAIKHRFVQPDNIYEEEIVVSVGPMQQVHALIEFGPEFRDELNRRWAEVCATSRLGQLGLFAGAGLLLLGSVFSYFRLDNATRGYYTGRLQFMAAAAILAVIGGGVFAARWITWL